MRTKRRTLQQNSLDQMNHFNTDESRAEWTPGFHSASILVGRDHVLGINSFIPAKQSRACEALTRFLE